MKLNFVSKGYFKEISQFVIIKQIGVGSFGKVSLALHIDTNKFYAIKIINLEKQDLDEKQLMLLQRQIYLHSEIDHPHIVKLWDTIGTEKQVFLVMDLAENSTLFAYQSKKGTLSQFQAFKYFYQTLKAIQYLHSINIMHRDIKPQNILLDKNFNAKICDLGWATQQIHQKRKTFCGTYEYMAPQMVFEKEYTYKVDVWALGVLLYQLLHGYAPFKGKSLQQIKINMAKGSYQIKSSFSQELRKLIIDLLQFDPNLRPQIQSVNKCLWIRKMRSQVLKEAMKIKQNFLKQSNFNKEQRSNKNIQTSLSQNNQKFLANYKKQIRKGQNNLELKISEDKFKDNNKEAQQTQLISTMKRMKKKCKTQGQQSLQKYQIENSKNSLKEKQNLKMNLSKKWLQVSNSSLKRSPQKESMDKLSKQMILNTKQWNSNAKQKEKNVIKQLYKTHMAKWSCFPYFDKNQKCSMGKYENNENKRITFDEDKRLGKNGYKFDRKEEGTKSKIKKISQKINDFEQRGQKNSMKKMRMKTYNCF